MLLVLLERRLPDHLHLHGIPELELVWRYPWNIVKNEQIQVKL